VALAYPEPQQGKRSTSLETKEVNIATLSQARAIVKWCPERAILVALAYPEPQQGKRNDLLKFSTSNGVDTGDLSRARAIVKWCPQRAILVALAAPLHQLRRSLTG
jgi:hypothetical protein